VGSAHLCGWLADGSVRCVGDNENGQLGGDPGEDLTGPVTVPGLEDVVSLSARWNTTCAVLGDGTARCWGSGLGGVLGDGVEQHPFCPDSGFFGCSEGPVPVSGLSGVVSVGVGSAFACALSADGVVSCWGTNTFGRLGVGSCWDLPCDSGVCTYSLTPLPVAGVSDAVALSVGSGRACAVLADGTVSCWGRGEYPAETVDGSCVAQPVDGPEGVVDIALGYIHRCALFDDGALRCWGFNGVGELGYGDLIRYDWPDAPPPPVPGLDDVAAVTAGLQHTCAILASGEPRCWGDNIEGQLGSGTSDWNLYEPTPVWGLPRVTSMVAGDGFTCATVPAGSAVCSGWMFDFPFRPFFEWPNIPYDIGL
jgi:alpha-tubulin suppressor-like RCC1 family protein